MNFKFKTFAQLVSKSSIDPVVWQKHPIRIMGKSGFGSFKGIKLDPKETTVIEDISDETLIDKDFRF